MSGSESASSESSPLSSRTGSPVPEANSPRAEEVDHEATEAEQILGDNPDKSSTTDAESDKKHRLLESEGVHLSWPDLSELVDVPGEDSGSPASFE